MATAMKSIYPLILLSVTISALAQVTLKAGMASREMQLQLAGGLRFEALLQVLLNPFVILGLGLYFGSAAIWLLVLSRAQLSMAYPFMALGFVLTAILGRLFFHDSLTLPKIGGTLLIVSGVLVLSRG